MVQLLKENQMVLIGKPGEICSWLRMLSREYKTVKELIDSKLKNM